MKLLLVDKQDNLIGYEEKEACHKGNGKLHRAFSVFIFNNKNELLIQKRSKYKPLWPLFWSNSCCSHPRKDESYEKAGERRLIEELGFTCKLKYLFKFQYQTRYKDIGSENEICAVLIGKSNAEPILNEEEVAEWGYVKIKDLLEDVKKNSNKYTPWFKIEIKEMLKRKLLSL